MKIGIRTHDLIKGKIEEVAKATKDAGFKNLQLVFKKALLDEDGNALIFSKDSAIKVSKVLNKYDINVAMLGAYFNPVHSNKNLVKTNVEYFKEHLKYASLLDCKYVGTETGSYNDDSWTYNPKNITEEGYQESISIFKELIKTAELYKTTLLMEPASGHIMYSVDRLKRAFDEINSPYLKITIDIYNLLNLDNYKDYKQIFEYALQTFQDNIKIIHLKDFNVVDKKLVQCGLGNGIIDFDFLLSTIKKYIPDVTMIFEGVVGNDIATSKILIENLIAFKK